MNFFLRLQFFIVLSICVYFVPGSQAALILKTKNNQALIHLEGMKTKRGSYFEVVDFYGQKKGLIQIKRVGQQKAIGVVKSGSIGKRWSLEPLSERRAVAQIQRQERSLKIARIQKEKIKKRLALKKKRLALKRKIALKKKRLALKRKIALKKKMIRKRRAARRALASYEGDSEHILDDLPEENLYQSQEVLSYGADSSFAGEEGFSKGGDETFPSGNANQNLYHSVHPGPSRVSLGLSPRFEYNVMNVNPEEENPSYLMRGLGYGLFAYFDFALNNFVRTELNLGWKEFSVGTEGQNCGNREDCTLKMELYCGLFKS